MGTHEQTWIQREASKPQPDYAEARRELGPYATWIQVYHLAQEKARKTV